MCDCDETRYKDAMIKIVHQWMGWNRIERRSRAGEVLLLARHGLDAGKYTDDTAETLKV